MTMWSDEIMTISSHSIHVELVRDHPLISVYFISLFINHKGITHRASVLETKVLLEAAMFLNHR